MQVSQIPAVNSTEGSTVTLQCHYTLSSTENVIIGGYKWYRHVLEGPEVSNDNGDYIGRVSRASQSEFFNNRSANIRLHRVELSDTGIYICEVTFVLSQTLQEHGNGTFLNVTADVIEVMGLVYGEFTNAKVKKVSGGISEQQTIRFRLPIPQTPSDHWVCFLYSYDAAAQVTCNI
ncbi:hypothetical protein XELAEV_18023786mg [Xenopus laevis]|uniref:Natural cytotoxicity triggering receptor 3 n=1 Tax=Xenopus laevis TaxID=8355 RepID=A0A974D779_XENLA|nr:hypothetical protein XELAEV_18023786mg [Xenopus laevis]